MDDETSENKVAHRPNAPVTKPEIFTFDYSRQVVKPLRLGKYKVYIIYFKILIVFF